MNISYGFGDIEVINLLCQQSPAWLIVTLKVSQRLERALHTLEISRKWQWKMAWSEDDSSWSIHGSLLIANYLNYGPWQIIFVVDYSQAVCAVAEVASGKSHAQIMLINSGGFRAPRLPGQATPTARAVSSWVEKNSVPPLNRRALDWSVVLTIGRHTDGCCPIVPQDNIVVSNKHNWPEFYLGNARACPGLEPPMLINGRDSAHDGVWSLLHACVATVTVLTDSRWLEILSAALHALCTIPYIWKGKLHKERESIHKFT